MNNASSPLSAAEAAACSPSAGSSPMSPPALSKSPLSSSLPGMTGDNIGGMGSAIMMANYPQPNSPNAYAPPDIEPPMSAQSSPEEAKEPLDSSKGRLIENEKVLEYGGPNNRYGKLNVILGKGAYKIVWKAIDREEGIEVAWNVLQTTKSEFNELSQEIEILTKVRHPNVINFHESWYDDGEFVFITELMTSGTLREYIAKFKSPSIKIIKRWARQILKGLAYLHSHNPPIIHRDIKCDNIFVNGSHGEIKIGDMGTAKMKFGKKYTVIGTPEFMAPEMYEEKGYSEKVDIYAFGMCLLEMITGEYPYCECKNAAQIYKKVTQGIRPECLAKVEDKEALSIINICLSGENDRWSAKKLLDFFFAEDPDVALLSVDDSKSKLTMQVIFKGSERQSIKFDFKMQLDTPEIVVQEMIDEGILSSRFQIHLTNEIYRIIRELSKQNSSVPMCASIEREVPPVPLFNNANSNNSTTPILSSSKQLEARFGKMNLLENSATSSTLSASDVTLREYSDNVSIEEFVSEVATAYNRGLDKASEWLGKLKFEDIDTVGDLRKLQEEDWAKLGLTVFASRALKNAMNGKDNGVSAVKTNGSSSKTNSLLLSGLSPRVTGRVSQTTDGDS